ncbi:MAG TPA: metallophosphoesterase family protein [Candidatus Limnocylindrales bacterium]|nr:metallophosphoesterase family protein [Candidatus Limnocylindrales bacterium]
MRIAVLSDVHSNLVALDAVLSAVGDVDAVWQLGDVVGYGPEPDGVIARLREVGAVGVRGNHDAAACGGSEIEWFNPDARRAMEWTRATISKASIEWLESLPDEAVLEGWQLVHGSPREPLWEYVTSVPVARANLAAQRRPACLHGHTHIPAAFVERDGRVDAVGPLDGSELELRGRRALLNPGSVGQPRDGDPRASYAILDPAEGRMRWHRVAYDVDAVQAAMRSAGLPPPLAARLSFGL